MVVQIPPCVGPSAVSLGPQPSLYVIVGPVSSVETALRVLGYFRRFHFPHFSSLGQDNGVPECVQTKNTHVDVLS